MIPKPIFVRTFIRVGNSLFGFLREALVFCEGKSEIANRYFQRANHSCRSFLKSNGSNLFQVTLLSFLKSEESDSLLLLFKKSNRAKSDRSDSFLGIKGDKNGKSSEEQGVFESKCAICSKKNKQITLLFFKSDRE